MDIDLLSKMVKELILDNDEVALPGVGSFVAEFVPAAFSDRGFTINPPYKRLSFKNKSAEGNACLVDFYAKNNNLDVPTATRVLEEFLKELRNVLEQKKIVIFPGLGKLRATKENYFFFVADEDLDIYPEGFGLEPVSLKTHEESPAEVSATMSALRSILNPEDADEPRKPENPEESEKSVESVASQEPDELDGHGAGEETKPEVNAEVSEVPEVQVVPEVQTAEDSLAKVNESISTDESLKEVAVSTNPNDEPSSISSAGEASAEENHSSANVAIAEQSGEKPSESTSVESVLDSNKSATKNTGWKALIWTAVALIALAITALAAFIILAHTAPDFVDSILYTPEELEIINWPLSNS